MPNWKSRKPTRYCLDSLVDLRLMTKIAGALDKIIGLKDVFVSGIMYIVYITNITLITCICIYIHLYIYLLYVIIYDYVHAIRQTPQKEGRKLRPSLQIFQDVHGRRDRRRPHNGGVKPMDPGVMKGDPGVPG